MKSLTKQRAAKHAITDAAMSDGPSPISSLITPLGVLQSEASYVVLPKDAPIDRAVRIPVGLLASSNRGAFEKYLLENGLSFLLNAATPKEISAFLRERLTNSNSVVIDTPGHHYVTISGVICQVIVHSGTFRWLTPATSDAHVTLIGAAAVKGKPESKSKKTTADFNDTFGPALRANPRLLTVLLFALAAMLVDRLAVQPLVLLLVGPSSIGKSILQRAVAWWVNGAGEVRMFDGTPMGLQKYLRKHPAIAVFFEDVHGGHNASAAAQLVMAAGNGAGDRLTARLEGSEKPSKSTASLVMSAETSMFTSMRHGRVALFSGVGARLFEVHAGPQGMFDALCGHKSSKSLAQFISSRSPEFHGVAGAAFVIAMADTWFNLPDLWARHKEKYRTRIQKVAEVVEVDGVDGRLLDQLALAAFAGELAIRRNVLKLEMGVVYSALGTLFHEHMKRSGAGRAPTADAVIEAVRHYLQTNAGKFDPLEELQGRRTRTGLAGYVKQVQTGEALYLFFPETFKLILPKGVEDQALEILERAGHLVHQEGRARRLQVRYRPLGSAKENPRKSMEFIAISASILEAEA